MHEALGLIRELLVILDSEGMRTQTALAEVHGLAFSPEQAKQNAEVIRRARAFIQENNAL